MNNLKADGNTIEITNGGSAIASGDPVLVGDVFGVAITNIGNGESGNLRLNGVYDLPCVSGGSTAWLQGVKLYWDAGNAEVTDDDDTGSNKHCGWAHAAKADGDTTALVRIASNTD